MYHNGEPPEPKPGGRRAYGGGVINKNRKIEKVDPLYIKEMRESWVNYIQSRLNSSAAREDLGRTGIRIKAHLPHGMFIPFLKKYLPEVCTRTVQRAMEIEAHFDFEAFPAFRLASRDQLKKIKDIYTFKETLDILMDNGINFEFDRSDTQKVSSFAYHLKQLADGKMGFLTPTEDEQNAERIIGPGGWEEIEGTINVQPDTEIEVPSFVKSTDFVLTKLTDFVRKLKVSRSDSGGRLGIETTRILLSAMIEISDTLDEIGPPQLTKSFTMEKPLNFFNKILNELDLSDDDDGLDIDHDDVDLDVNHDDLDLDELDDVDHDDLDLDELDELDDKIVNKKSIKATAKQEGKKVVEDGDDDELDDYFEEEEKQNTSKKKGAVKNPRQKANK